MFSNCKVVKRSIAERNQVCILINYTNLNVKSFLFFLTLTNIGLQPLKNKIEKKVNEKFYFWNVIKLESLHTHCKKHLIWADTLHFAK
jgi:hypothetical protein